MAGIESSNESTSIGCDQCRPLLAWNPRNHASPRVDGGGDSSVGGTEQPAVIFDGAHARLIQVLRVGAAVTVPSVVGNIYEHLRSLVGELADLVGENGFVADEQTKSFVSRIERTARDAVLKLSNFLCQAARK